MNPLEEIPRMSFLDITGKWDSPRVPTPAIKLGRSQHWRLQPLFTKADHAAEHSRIGNPGTPTYSYGVEFYDYWVPKINWCLSRLRKKDACTPPLPAPKGRLLDDISVEARPIHNSSRKKQISSLLWVRLSSTCIMSPAATTNGTANGPNGHAAKLDFKVS